MKDEAKVTAKRHSKRKRVTVTYREASERFNANVAKAHQCRTAMKWHLAEMMQEARTHVLPVYDELRELNCVICGAPMKAKRVTRRTCSGRCRARLSRLIRAERAARAEREDNKQPTQTERTNEENHPD